MTASLRFNYLVAATLLAAAGPAAAQSRYTYNPAQGGLVDSVADASGDHLVWSAGTGLRWINGTYSRNYYSAVDYLPAQYAATEHGAGYSDWRCPTLSEIQSAAASGIYNDLLAAAAVDGVPAPDSQTYWASSPTEKKFGHLRAPACSLLDGGWFWAGAEGSSGYAILVRGAAPPAPTKPGKGN